MVARVAKANFRCPSATLSATNCAPTSHSIPRLFTTARRHNMSDSTSQPPDTKMEANDELDQSVENEINHDATQADAMNLDGATDDAPNGVPEPAVAFEQRIPAKKDATLREFLGKMDEYAPIVSTQLLGLPMGVLTQSTRYLTQSPTTT